MSSSNLKSFHTIQLSPENYQLYRFKLLTFLRGLELIDTIESNEDAFVERYLRDHPPVKPNTPEVVALIAKDKWKAKCDLAYSKIALGIPDTYSFVIMNVDAHPSALLSALDAQFMRKTPESTTALLKDFLASKKGTKTIGQYAEDLRYKLNS